MPYDGSANDAIPRRRGKRGPKPKPVEEFPEAISERWIDLPGFHEALALHARRHGESCWRLHRAVVRSGEKLDRKTIQDWVSGRKAPRSVLSMEILRRIEVRYRLPEGYFRGKLPHRSRASHGHSPVGIGPSERRRLAWHLPDNFKTRPPAEQHAIIEWVRRNIISGSTP
jgi:hypothetical protein